jgi:ParB-like chromosome segregation protein Spo0J
MSMQIKEMKISEIKANPNNPRLIKDDKFAKLVKSIKEFPEMLKLRPIVVNDDMIVLGGNMRLKACKEAGLKVVPVIKASELSEEQQREFIIKDNVGFGEWDWDMLGNEWPEDKLEEWGLEVPNFNETNYSDKNKEIDVDDLDTKMTIKLNYTEEEYWKVKTQLSEIAATPEQAIWKLLKNE